jgi:hypothetical protein
MIVTISQPRYLPWLGYFHKIGMSDVFMYLDTVQYTPRDWENRNKIKTDRGWTWLTVPVKARYRAVIPEVLVDNEQSWAHKHWNSIRTFYSAAPYFTAYAEGLRTLYLERIWTTLIDLNLALTHYLCQCFGFTRTKIVKASDCPCARRGTDLLVDLAQGAGATVYYSGSQGRKYVDESKFHAVGIQVAYQDYRHPQYPQAYGPFKPAMAAVDLLFHCGPASAEIILKGQEPVGPSKRLASY